MLHRSLPVAASLAALSTFAAAQTPVRLIGFTQPTPKLVTQDMSTCVQRECTPGVMPPPAVRWAGGTAYDPTVGGVWVSNGTMLARLDADSCRAPCAPFAAPVAGAASVVTGLALNERQRTLFLAEDPPAIAQVQNDCPLTGPVARCRILFLTANHRIGGLATSDVQDLIFYSSSDFGGGPPGNTIYVAKQSDPCNPFCRFTPPSCATTPLGPITGLAFDDCKDALWYTDGRTTVGATWGGGASRCAAVAFQCCTNPNQVEPYVGLCVRPSHATSSGRNCTRAPCPTCPNMAQATNGDPTLGNLSFALHLDNAPAGESAFLVVNAGPCTVPGVLSPPLCAPVLVPFVPPPIVVGPLGTGGPGGCSGAVRVKVPIPLRAFLCGTTLSSQFVVLCRAPAGFGHGVSNCLGWTITGS